MRLPQLWGVDLDAVTKWINETISFFDQQQDSLDGETTVSSESVGMARVWLGPTVPDGWLALNGTYVFISEAEALYELLGNAGGAPPPGMFKLPDAPTALASGIWIVKR